MGVARSINTSHSSSEDPYLSDEGYEWGATSDPHEWMWGSGSRPRRLPSRSSSESPFVVPDQEDAEEEDGQWVTRAEADHARRMAVALLEDQTRIQSLEQELVNSQEMADMMGEIVADLSCRCVENGMELAQSREQGIVLLWMVLVLFGFVMAFIITH